MCQIQISGSYVRTTFMALIFVCALSSNAQPQPKKSKAAYSSNRNTNLISFYLDSAQYLSSRAPFRAIDKINKAIELSLGANDRNNEALSYWILGNIQQNLHQHELACENYKKSISTIVRSGTSKKSDARYSQDDGSSQTLFNAYKHLAVSLLKLNRDDEALAYITRCSSARFTDISKAEKLDASRVQADILLKQGNENEANSLLVEILEGEEKLMNREGQIKTLMALGALQNQLKNSGKAIGYYTQARVIAETLKNQELLLQVNNALALIFREQKKPEKELEVRSSNIALSNTSNSIKEVEQQNKEIGKAYVNSDQMDKALPFFEKSLYRDKENKQVIPENLFGKSKDLEGMADTYKLLAEEYLKRGNTEKATEYLKSFIKVQDSIKSIRNRELSEALKLSNQIGKNQQRIELLEKERKLSEKSIEVLKQDKELREEELYTRNIIIGSLSVLLVFMLVGAYYILKSSREKRRANQLLAIKSLQGQMNPHFIFNALNSVNHYISQNDERSANKYLSDFSKLMRSVMETSKHDLIVLGEEVEILRLYLRLEHSRFKENFDYTFTVDEEIDESEFELPPMIIQPFIENAIWHGLRYIDGKGMLSVHFKKNKDGLIVEISDNGIGRKKSLEIKTRNQKLQNSTGMQNIETRIGILNELFNTQIKAEIFDAFEGQNNPGTKVILFIPKKINHYA